MKLVIVFEPSMVSCAGTKETRSGRSVRVWREQVGRQLIQLDFEPSDAPFQASIEPILSLGAPHVVRLRMSPGKLFRDRGLAALGTPSRTLLIANTDDIRVTHKGREVRLARGDATVFDNWLAGSVTASGEFAFTSVMLNVDDSRWSGIPVNDTIGGHVRRDNDALRLLAGYLRFLDKKASALMSPDLGALAARQVEELVFHALARRSYGAERDANNSLQAARALALTDFIERHFQNPDLSRAGAAAALRISVRYLDRLLEASGRSFAERVMDLRLEAAFALLRSTDNRHLRVFDIAQRCGFTDLSHFTRRFRTRFGASPGAILD